MFPNLEMGIVFVNDTNVRKRQCRSEEKKRKMDQRLGSFREMITNYRF